MSDDRRRYDPFAPHALVGAVAPPEPQVEDDNTDPDFEDMRKADLVALAEDRGLPSYGSKADIIDRLRA